MKNFSRGWYLIEMHLAIFGHLPEAGDEELTELEYAKRFVKLDPPTSIKNLDLLVLALNIIKEHEAGK